MRETTLCGLTRAKKKVLPHRGKTSPFLDEIIQSPYDIEILGKEPSALPTCSKCIEGKLTLKDSENGKFWGCNNFPYCEYKEQPCPHCKKGYPKLNDDNILACDFANRLLLDVLDPIGGHLQQEKGPFSTFWGCSQFRSTGCDFKTKNLDKLEDKNGERPRKNLPWGKPKEVPSVSKVNTQQQQFLKPAKKLDVEKHTKSPTKNNIEELRKRH